MIAGSAAVVSAPGDHAIRLHSDGDGGDVVGWQQIVQVNEITGASRPDCCMSFFSVWGEENDSSYLVLFGDAPARGSNVSRRVQVSCRLGGSAPKERVSALSRRVSVLIAPSTRNLRTSTLDLRWLLKKLGAQNVTSLLVEGGGEVNGSFLLKGFTQRIAFFYAPKILGGRDSRQAVACEGATRLNEALGLSHLEWRKLGPDLLLTAQVQPGAS